MMRRAGLPRLHLQETSDDCRYQQVPSATDSLKKHPHLTYGNYGKKSLKLKFLTILDASTRVHVCSLLILTYHFLCAISQKNEKSEVP